jgi:hypothetical protein
MYNYYSYSNINKFSFPNVHHRSKYCQIFLLSQLKEECFRLYIINSCNGNHLFYQLNCQLTSWNILAKINVKMCLFYLRKSKELLQWYLSAHEILRKWMNSIIDIVCTCINKKKSVLWLICTERYHHIEMFKINQLNRKSDESCLVILDWNLLF